MDGVGLALRTLARGSTRGEEHQGGAAITNVGTGHDRVSFGALVGAPRRATVVAAVGREAWGYVAGTVEEEGGRVDDVPPSKALLDEAVTLRRRPLQAVSHVVGVLLRPAADRDAQDDLRACILADPIAAGSLGLDDLIASGVVQRRGA